MEHVIKANIKKSVAGSQKGSTIMDGKDVAAISQKKIDIIGRLRSEGKSLAMIASITKIPRTTVVSLVKKHGLKKRPSKNRKAPKEIVLDESQKFLEILKETIKAHPLAEKYGLSKEAVKHLAKKALAEQQFTEEWITAALHAHHFRHPNINLLDGRIQKAIIKTYSLEVLRLMLRKLRDPKEALGVWCFSCARVIHEYGVDKLRDEISQPNDLYVFVKDRIKWTKEDGQLYSKVVKQYKEGLKKKQAKAQAGKEGGEDKKQNASVTKEHSDSMEGV